MNLLIDTPLSEIFRLNDFQKKALKRLSLSTAKELLYHFPTRFEEFSPNQTLKNSPEGATGVWYGEIESLSLSKTFKKRVAIAEGYLNDGTEKIKLIWFNQPYLAKMLKERTPVRVSGKIMLRRGEKYIANPEITEIPELPKQIGSSLFNGNVKDSVKNEETYITYPIYPETRGISSKWFYHGIQKIFKNGILENLIDPIPKEILSKYNLPSLKTALVWIHTPKSQNDYISARKRFSFEEVFYIQLAVNREKQDYKKHQSYKIEVAKEKIENFLERFPFRATSAQNKAIEAILNDFKKSYPMSRLLEGDVGSGKTAVATTVSFATVTNKADVRGIGNLQVAYMAPTEILAGQHFENFIQYFKHIPIQIGLITGSVCRKFPSKINADGTTIISKNQLLKWVKEGDISILIGTHSLIQKTVTFRNLGLAIIDEQHRFGTKQRQKLAKKVEPVPHLLSMTATPIPRTLALTVYGDLDLTLLDEMPAGRKPIITEIVMVSKRPDAYEKIKKELKNGHQVYIICPRINEPDPSKEMALLAKSVSAEAKRLKKDIFPEYKIEILHSKMKPKEKDDVMQDFKNKKIDILVATSVVEVGVNVPNATVIVIEGAERFGLAQLHQLRGRVIRSNDQAYCYVFTEKMGEKTKDRLSALKTAKNGFELAEYDLKLRGSGELMGNKQWGVSDIGMEAIRNIKMVEAARTEAKLLIEDDSNLSKYPILASSLAEKIKTMHFE